MYTACPGLLSKLIQDIMFNQFEPNVKATITYLKLLQVKVNSTTVNETLQNHPDWPSLLCISDSLNKWNLANAAGKIEPEQIEQLPVPFIANVKDRAYPLAIVTDVAADAVTFLSKNYTKTKTTSKEEFFRKWTGIYLIAEPSETSGEKNYKSHKQESLLQASIPVAFLLLVTGFLFAGVFRNATAAPAAVSTGVYLQWNLSLAGALVTSMLLWYELDKNNPLLQKVCTGIVKGNCNAILTGGQAKVFNWLSWSEVGFFYFSGSLLGLSYAGGNAIAAIGWLNILALPYTVFSVYYQWRVAKQWCVLCLAVQVLLLLGAVNVLINGLLLPSGAYAGSSIIYSLFLFVLPALLWYAIKPFVLKLQESKNTKRQYLRIKFNSQIFETLLKKQKAITIPTEGLGIIIGNPNATNTLIKVCSPYCGPCARAHTKIEKLLEELPNLKAQIIFTAPDNTDNYAYEPVSHLLAIASENEGSKTKQALDDWYLPPKKDYDVFKSKYPLNGELTKQGRKIEAMDKWCKAMDIKATPTILINGYQLPDAYSVEDIQYFLLE